MSYCLNSNCQSPQNPDDAKFCLGCGAKLLLAERYRAIKPIGQGGFGRTFLAVDEYKPSKPQCVIKQFFPQAQGTNNPEKAAELFRQEAVRLDQLGKHPQIPELLAYFIQEQRQYLVQEFVDGKNLAQELARKGYFSEEQIRQLLNDLLPVLQFVHEGHVIHRDIKPQNIVRRTSDQKLALVDFGAAKYATETALAVTGTVIGSAGYTAPEQAIGKAIFASDLFSLGVTCIHLLTQRPPFDLYSVSEGGWIWQEYLITPISDSLSQVLEKMLVTATKRRYQSAAEVLQDLNSQLIEQEQNLASQPIAETPTNSAETPSSVTSLPHPSCPETTTQEIHRVSRNWKCVHTLSGHSWGVNAVVITPDGQTLISGSRDQTLKIWQIETGQLLDTLRGHTNWVWSLVLSWDGQTLISGSGDKTIKIWQLENRQLLHTLTSHDDWVWSLALSRDAQTLASGSVDKTIKLWNVATGELQQTLSGHSNSVTSVVISWDGQTLVSGSGDATIKIWELASGELRRTLNGHKDWVRSVAISPDGQTLVSGSFDTTLKLWNLQTGELLHTLTGHLGPVTCVAISCDGQILASGGRDKIIKIWHLPTGELISSCEGHLDAVDSLAVSPDGKRLVSGSLDTTIRIWQGD